MFQQHFKYIAKACHLQGGGYILITKPNEYDILTTIGAFRGLTVSYDIGPGGNYHIKLTSAEWSTFQVNLGATGTVHQQGIFKDFGIIIIRLLTNHGSQKHFIYFKLQLNVEHSSITSIEAFQYYC